LARWLAPLSSALLLIAPTSPAAQAIPETQPRPSSPRFVHAHYAWAQHKMLEDAPPGPDISGLMLTGHVKADEMRGETMIAEIRLRRPNGKPVMAAKGAPAGYADEKGCFVGRFTEKVPSDKAEWKSIHLWVPFAALDLAPGRQHKLILTFLASAGGLTATREQDIALRLPGAQAQQVLPGPASQPQVRETEPEIVIDTEQHRLARVKELLDVGKLTPEELFLSAKKNEKSVVRFLLDNGADVFARDLEGRTPLHVAAANGHREIAAMLIPASISPRGPKKPDKPPPTPGEKKESKALFEFDAEYLESLSFDKFLENAHCYVSLTDDNGSTPLHLAASNGHYDVADLLVGYGADVNAANKKGRTSLHAAAVAGDDAIVALLLLNGADAKVRDEKGNTPSDVATSDSVKRRLKKAAGAAAPTADSEGKVVRAA